MKTAPDTLFAYYLLKEVNGKKYIYESIIDGLIETVQRDNNITYTNKDNMLVIFKNAFENIEKEL